MRPDLPTGVVTLLFTDIEGSTRLLAERRSGYVEVLSDYRSSLSAFALGDYQSALDFALAAYEGFSDVGHGWGRAIAAARMAFAYLGLGRISEGHEWGRTALRLAPSGLRLGRL